MLIFVHGMSPTSTVKAVVLRTVYTHATVQHPRRNKKVVTTLAVTKPDLHVTTNNIQDLSHLHNMLRNWVHKMY